MRATSSHLLHPALTSSSWGFSRLLCAGWDAIATYCIRRAAIARLREADDRELRDIGLARAQIEAAVKGLVTLAGEAPRGSMASSAARRLVSMGDASSWN